METLTLIPIFTGTEPGTEWSWGFNPNGLGKPSIILGEEGPGRKLRWLPIDTCSKAKRFYRALIRAEGGLYAPLWPAGPSPEAETFPRCILILRPDPPHFGHVEYTGDRATTWSNDQPTFYPLDPWRAKTLLSGIVAQGRGGRAGTSEHRIIWLMRDYVIRTGYTGRTYGKPSSHYWMFDGRRVLCSTWQDRQLLPDEHPFHLPLIRTLKGENAS